jgi:hypothetical protein
LAELYVYRSKHSLTELIQILIKRDSNLFTSIKQRAPSRTVKVQTRRTSVIENENHFGGGKWMAFKLNCADKADARKVE